METRVDGFIFYASYYDGISELPEEDQGQLYRAVFRYVFEDIEPELSGAPLMAFKFMKPTIDANIKRRLNGKLGGRPKDEEKTKAITKGKPKANQKQTKPITKGKPKDKEEDKDNEKDISLTGYIEKAPKPQDVIDLYNDICIDMPRVRVMTEARRKHIQARLKENKPEEIREVFERAEASDFLSGRVEGKDFRADFDWIVGNPQHWQRIIEGVYDNRSGRKKKDAVDTLQAALNVSDEERAEAIRLG